MENNGDIPNFCASMLLYLCYTKSFVVRLDDFVLIVLKAMTNCWVWVLF